MLCGVLAIRAEEGWTRLGRHEEALKDWDRARALNDARFREGVEWGRACTLGRLGDYPAALKAAAAVQEQTAQGPVLLSAARCYAIACGAVAKNDKLSPAERTRLAEQYAARSVELLRQASAKGLTRFGRPVPLEWLRKNPDFTPLSTRTDFQQLLGDLEKKSKPAG
jgi:hypothetical protein